MNKKEVPVRRRDGANYLWRWVDAITAANAEKDELSKAEGEAPAFEDVESGKDEGGSNPEKPSEEDASAETEGGEEKEGKDTGLC